MTDLIPAPRPVPTREDRMRDARTDFGTYLDRTERDQFDARAATAEQERDDALDDRDQALAERNEAREAAKNIYGTLKTIERERDEAIDCRNVLRQQLDQARAELADAQELLAVVDDLAEQLDRARARYATRDSGKQLQHVSVLGNCIACGSHCPNGRCPNDKPSAGLGSPEARAQDEPARRGSAENCWCDVPTASSPPHRFGTGRYCNAEARP